MRDLYIKRNELCKKSCDMRTAKWDLDIKPDLVDELVKQQDKVYKKI